MADEEKRLYLRPKDAQARTGVPAGTWRRWATSGRIRSSKVGKVVVIPIDEIDRLLREGDRPAR